MTLLCITGVLISALVTMSSLLVINVKQSASMLHAISWFIWFIVDMALSLSIQVGSGVILFPSIWLLIAVNYRLDVQHVMRTVDDALAVSRSTRASSADTVSRILDQCQLLKHKARGS